MRTLVVALLLGLFAVPVGAQESGYDIPAHISAVEGDAVLERADDGNAENIEPNITLIEGDIIRTRAGRVEVLFADGTRLHIDRDTRVDLLRADYARVMEGRVRILIPRDARDIVRIDAPAATMEMEPGGGYRIAVAPNGDAELAVLAGDGAIFNQLGDTRLGAGERAVAAVDRAPSEAYYFNASAASLDDFDRWSERRNRAYASSESISYLPDELRSYGSVFDTHGRWSRHAEYGYVWYPRAAVSWQPYSHGRWRSYPRYGWTWIGNDPWAWPTHHFGRWGFSAGVWFWIPGRTWGPAWVSWARSPGYVGWSPLGWDNRPIYAIGNARRAHYSSSYPWCGWSFIREREFGGRWRSGGLVHGRGVGVIVTAGIATSNVAPVAPRTRRAVPRSGVAVPRTGSAAPRVGSPRVGSPRGGVDATRLPKGRSIRDRRSPRQTGDVASGATPTRRVRERGVSERGTTERGANERGISERGVRERGVSQRGASEGASERPVRERTVTPRAREGATTARPSGTTNPTDRTTRPVRRRVEPSAGATRPSDSTQPRARERRPVADRPAPRATAPRATAPRARSRGEAPSASAPRTAPRVRERAPIRSAPPRATSPRGASRDSAPPRVRSRQPSAPPTAAPARGGSRAATHRAARLKRHRTAAPPEAAGPNPAVATPHLAPASREAGRIAGG